ncbi:hypothetical protein ACLOJK_041845 [Asimina triloba]
MVVGFLREISTTRDCSKRIMKLAECVKCLEEERTKIDVFKRELPLCMLLLNDVIEALKKAEKQSRHCNGSSGPVLEEFIQSKFDEDEGVKMENDARDKMNWMSSAQLWSDSTDGRENNSSLCIKRNKSRDVKEEKERHQFLDEKQFHVSDYNKGGCVFSPLSRLSSQKAEEVMAPVPDLCLLSPGIKIPSGESGSAGSNLKSGLKDGVVPSATDPSKSQPPRKARRCWSPELHRRFVNALQQLGGSQVATPKQIREVMHIDGLTNDEVKSHLQKYRLHTRRLPASAPAVTSQPVVVVGGALLKAHFHCPAQPKQSPLLMVIVAKMNKIGPKVTVGGADFKKQALKKPNDGYRYVDRLHEFADTIVGKLLILE